MDVGSGSTPDTPEVPTHATGQPGEAERVRVALDHEIAGAAARLERLRERGLLTDDEFQIAMDQIMRPAPAETPAAETPAAAPPARSGDA